MKHAMIITCLSVLLALGACTAKPIPGAQPPGQREHLAYLKKTAAAPLTCRVGADCSEKWARAVAWVTAHSTYSIKTSTNNEITTAGPIEPTTDSAFHVTRTVVDANISAINFSSTCGENALCSPMTLELSTSFHNFVMYGK